jgi:membrane protease YdiL (CAAX protease family)
LSSGIAVALIEETVMRGAMHSAIARESGQWAAVLFTAPLFAVLHFFAKARIPIDELHWASGFDLLGRSFAPLSTPSLVFDSFAAWLAVSLVLSLTRVLTGTIATALGLHAGWVVVLRMLQEATAPGPDAHASAWVGKFDGLLGYWVLPWSAAIGLALWLMRRAWVPYASGAMSASRSRRSTGSSISK